MADDFAGNIATLGTFTVGARLTGNIEAPADQDWFKGFLFAGHTYVIQERGTPTTDGTLSDPRVRLHDEAGTQIAVNDDGGIGFNSYLRFVPETSGVYFIDARHFSTGALDTGTYEIEVAQQSDALLNFNRWGSGLSSTVLLGDVNRSPTDVDPVDNGQGVREDLVSITATGNVFVSFSTPAGFADPVLATTGATTSDRLFSINNAVDNREDLFQIFGGSAFVALGNNVAGDGLDNFTFWGSGFLPSAVATHNFDNDGRIDAFQISGGNAQISVQNATNNGFVGFTNWATGLIGNEQVLEFNGDGRADLLQIFNGRAYVATSTGATFNPFTVVDQGLTASDRVGDFNFDGLDDLFQIYNGNMYVSLSNGTTFNGFTQWGSGVTSSNIRIGDINGDRRADIVQIDASGHATAAVANSLATGFSSFTPWASSVGANDQIGLINGDTLADIVQVFSGNAYVWESNVVPAF